MARGFQLSFSRCLIAALVAATSASCFAARIPEVHGTSLSNETVNLPEALEGKTGILVLGFSRGSRDGVSGWGKRLAADYRRSPGVVYYEMPVLASVPGLMRGLVVRSMKSSVPERAQSRFVPITDKEPAWRTIVHYGASDDPYLLVVNGQGDVIWQTQGQPTDSAYAALKQRIDASNANTAR
jgi:hypothetical protein